MRSKLIKNKGHLNKAWVVWQVNKWTTIWTRTMYTCLGIHVHFYFLIFDLKKKTFKKYYYYFWMKSKFNRLWYMYFFLFLFESIASFSGITWWKFILKLYIIYICTFIDRILSSTSCLLQLIAFSWIVFSVCKVCTLEEECITCTIVLLWSWQEIEEFDNTKEVIRIRK